MDTIMMWGYGWSGLGMLMMMLNSLLWIALIALLLWAMIFWVNKKHPHMTTPSDLEILRQRYARGEIDTVTFEQMRERLETFREQEKFSS